MNTKTRVGIIGLGTIGRTHARALHVLRDRADVVVYSGGGDRSLADDGWPGAVQRNPQDVVGAGVDVIAISSPSGTHAEHALNAVRSGCHVLVEKPIALNTRDARAIVETATANDRIASAVSQRRFEPEVQALRRALNSGALGPIRLAMTNVNWQRGEDYFEAAAWRSRADQGGGSLINQGVHNVDLMQWLGGQVISVTAESATLAHAGDAEDVTVATIRFTSGALGLISTSTATPPGDPATLTLHCARGTVVLGQGEIVRWDVDGVAHPRIEPSELTIASGASDPRAIGIAGHVDQWRDMLDAIDQHRQASITAEDALSTVELIEAIYAAARDGKRTDVTKP